MKKILSALIATVFTAYFVSVAVANTQSKEFVMIANTNLALGFSDVAMKQEVRLLYLKQKKKWPRGEPSHPVSLKDNSEGQRRFREKILNMSEYELDNHWTIFKQNYGVRPPPTMRSERLTLHFVARKEGAVGYVSKATYEKIKGDVKVLFEF